MRALFITPVVGDTKDVRRIETFRNCGISVEVASFQRNNPVFREFHCRTTYLGRIDDQKYLSRIPTYLRAVLQVRREAKDKDIIVAMAPDLAFMAYIATFGLKKKLFLDVSDIQRAQISRSFAGKLMRAMERFVCRRVSLLMVTAGDFVDFYYKRYLKVDVDSVIVVENKVDYQLALRPERRSLNNNPIVIGYFGVIRSPWSIAVLSTLVEKHPGRFAVLVAGVDKQNVFDLNELSFKLDNFNYVGPYTNFEQLQELYGRVDISFGCYPDPTEDRLWRIMQEICRSNRFYEALYFRKPLISLAGSADARYVKELDAGFVFEGEDVDHMVAQIAAIDAIALNRCTAAIDSVPASIFMMESTIEDLREAIAKI